MLLTLNKWAENFNNNIDQVEKLGFSKKSLLGNGITI